MLLIEFTVPPKIATYILVCPLNLATTPEPTKELTNGLNYDYTITIYHTYYLRSSMS